MAEIQSEYNSESKVLAAALDLGVRMLICGGEVSRVEDTIRRVCLAYGADRVGVLTITSCIIATVHFPASGSISQTRRITAQRFDLATLSALNELSRRACRDLPSPEELLEEVDGVQESHAIPLARALLLYAAASGFFCLFFGGSLLDCVAAFFIGAVIRLIQTLFTTLEVNSYFTTILCCVMGGLISHLLTGFMPVNQALINIGVIMLVVPGSVLTGAIRDIFSGDTITGLLRFSEALVLSVAIAWGFAVFSEAEPTTGNPAVWVQLVSAFGGTLCFSMLYNVGARQLLPCALGGSLTWGVMLIMRALGLSEFGAYFVASAALAAYALIFARRLLCPATVFLVTVVLPLLPGGSLYLTMHYAVFAQWKDFADAGMRTLAYAIMISGGMLFTSTLTRAYAVAKGKLSRRVKKG